MKIKFRLRIWILTSVLCIGIIIIAYFKIPLKSKPAPSKYIQNAQKKALESFFKDREIHTATTSVQQENVGEDSQSILTNTFKKADENKDDFVDTIELIAWIALMIKQHLTQALKSNIFVFTALDVNPRDGLVSWEEYLRSSLKQRGHDDIFVENHLTSLKGMDRQTKENVMRDKAAWSQASRGNPSKLSLDEFFAFRHPESSHASIIAMVDESLARLDIDEDGMLSENEFSDPEVNEVPEQMTNTEFVKERVRDFHHFLDANGDGKAEKKELINYYNPNNAQHAEKEAMELIGIADTDGDRKLTLNEILAHKDRFMRSKMVNVALSFHDEF